MKRFLLIIALLLSAVTLTNAQSGFNVNKLFDGRYKHSSNATEIVVKGRQADALNLRLYHSMSIVNDAQAARFVEQLVIKDGARANSKEVEYRGGHLYYGFYVFNRKDDDDCNRYILYLNQNLAHKQPVNDKVMMIYLESDQNSRYIKKLIKNSEI
jgi:hypothetical protein